MTREEAIKRLEDTFEAWEGWIPHNDSPASKLSEALGMAIAALREQETVTNRNGLNGWISVKDRLPPEGERVLATDGAFVGEMYINKRGKWQRYNVNDSALLMALDILWWMPLPQAPEEEV